jgi:cation diffusion facilitator family transporter
MPAQAPHHHNQEDHHHAHTWWERIAATLHLPGYAHRHELPDQGDAIYKNELGIRTIKQALAILGFTTVIQAGIYLLSGSVALLADTVHNLGDALNSVPLWIAFVLSRRAATRRYTYGFGRSEDVAGILIVLSIAFSAGYIIYEAVSKLIDPQFIAFGGWVALAALLGFIGNEAVAILQIRVGKRIGSEAMVTDGRHARVDGLTSLAVLPAVLGSWLGLPVLDPIFGLLIGAAIVFITWNAIVAMWYRLMDAVDPELVDRAEAVMRRSQKVLEIDYLRMRWVGHSLHLESRVYVELETELSQLEDLKEDIAAGLRETLPHLTAVAISVSPLPG